MATKEHFVASLGGPDAPVGSGGMTAQQLADRVEACLDALVTPGRRVHPPELNRDRFWEAMIGD